MKSRDFSNLFLFPVFLCACLLVYIFGRTSPREQMERRLLAENDRRIRVIETVLREYAWEHLRTSMQHTLGMLDTLQRNDVENADALAMDFLETMRIGASGRVVRLDLAHDWEDQDGFTGTDLSKLLFIQKRSGREEGFIRFDWRPRGQTSAQAAVMYVDTYEPWQWRLAAVAYPGEMSANHMDVIWDYVVEITGEEEGLRSFLLSPEGNLVGASSESSAKFYEKAREDIQSLVTETPHLPGKAWLSRKNLEGEKYLLSCLAVPETPYLLVTLVASDGIARLGHTLNNRLLWSLVVLSLLLAVVAAIWLERLQRQKETIRIEADSAIQKQVQSKTDELEHLIVTLKQNLDAKEKTNQELTRRNNTLKGDKAELEKRSNEILFLNQMGDLLQACQTVEETDKVIAQLSHEFFPDDAGVLCRYNDEQSVMETVMTWGEIFSVEGDFLVEDCWALRRSKVYDVESSEADLICGHLTQKPPHGYVCLPINAQGELLGLLHIEWGGPAPDQSRQAWAGRVESKRRLASTVTEQFGLALANLKLREMLRHQSIRDQLTGLYNRRHMEETLTREIHRARRKHKSLGIIMIDVDHFKRFNDTYGHEDGDVVLRELGSLLKTHTRQEDVACRYGGEEFLLIMPDAELQIAQERAEQLRNRVKTQLKVREQTVTISVGVSVFPEHGAKAEMVVNHADTALYRAKKNGRDQVVVWDESLDTA